MFEIFISKIKTQAGGMAQAVEYLPSKVES
jgi:hypothetical protein